ncbi:MAG: crossover junction endodeoxyribonuclease RuvC [Syntrophales bacterium]|nr:crossover junction endodeoxyribonuclease RuvC [Syntrophales bacterium]
MVVLGVDPGSVVTGYGVIRSESSDLIPVSYGEFVVGKGETLSFFLMRLFENLKKIINETCPDVMAIEQIFLGKNVKSLIKQGHVRGVIILAGSSYGLPVYEYSSLEVKKAVTGYGRAGKSQVQRMVQRILGITEIPGEDAADALAVALCHVQLQGFLTRINMGQMKTTYGMPRRL